MINHHEVDVRLFERRDIDSYCEYFFRSPPEFLRSLGFDTTQDSPDKENAARARLNAALATQDLSNPQIKSLVVEYRGKSIGFHTFTQYDPGESITIHAHFFDPDARYKGIGPISGFKAIEYALRNYSIKYVVIAVPIQNRAPSAMVDRFNLTPLREEVLNAPGLIPNLKVRIYHVDLAMVEKYRTRVLSP